MSNFGKAFLLAFVAVGVYFLWRWWKMGHKALAIGLGLLWLGLWWFNWRKARTTATTSTQTTGSGE